jgi:DNA-binding transcriptional regulator YiaG
VAGKRKTITFEIDANGCHICTSHAVDIHGYPHVWKNNRGHNLHRVLYEEKHGPLPKEILVRHTCDVRKCINLEHLISGTTKDNAVDRKERGRNNTPHGETRSDAKLTKEQVKYIRTHLGASQRELAELLGINQSTVSRIKRGLTWTKTTT